jgi:A/G-specific adenine glycosylase
LSRPGIAAQVIRWQRQHGRQGLPWQASTDPYCVWLSEVMLQQTQVATVLGYYERFLQRFPTVVALAAAPLDDVLALWSGLGYYSRARNLHRCAQVVVAEHGGVFPNRSVTLAQLPGIGRSTAAAIAAFCFGERVAILDGNVKRVLARALGFEGDLARATEVEALWALAQGLLPRRDMGVYTQGLMDLGATVCSARKPACMRCPLAARCVAQAGGEPERLPVKTRRAKRSQRESALLLLLHRGQVWLVQRPATGVWAGLWTLPLFDSSAALDERTHAWPGRGERLPTFKHALTHFDWTLHPLRWHWPERRNGGLPLTEGRWFALPEALALGLPAPIRRLIEANQF